MAHKKLIYGISVVALPVYLLLIQPLITMDDFRMQFDNGIGVTFVKLFCLQLIAAGVVVIILCGWARFYREIFTLQVTALGLFIPVIVFILYYFTEINSSILSALDVRTTFFLIASYLVALIYLVSQRRKKEQ